MTDNDFFRDQAENFANVSIIEKDIIATVHLEDQKDEEFWNTRLQEVQRGQYNFIYFSRIGSNTQTCASGSIQCLRYIGHFSRRFFACVDSDLHYLQDNPKYNPENFVVQTYTYSWENHICETFHLQKRYDKSYYKKSEFSFEFTHFFYQLSEILYLPLLYLIHFSKNNSKMWNVKLFNSCIPPQFKKTDLASEGQNFLETTRTNFEESLKNLPIEAQKLEEIKNQMQTKGLTPSNAYLYIQGHKLYGLVKMIGGYLMDKSGNNFEQECMRASSAITNYDEVERIKKDLKNILS